MDKCKRCGTYIYNDSCNCEKYLVYHIEYNGDDPMIWYGNDFENVAGKYAMKYNEDDYTCNENLFETPIVIENKEGVRKSFQVYAEPEINYYPKEIKGEQNEKDN